MDPAARSGATVAAIVGPEGQSMCRRVAKPEEHVLTPGYVFIAAGDLRKKTTIYTAQLAPVMVATAEAVALIFAVHALGRTCTGGCGENSKI
ncbi:predicted protein [Sclerotinia sclerotiorum 1980 UF-70]|uniref:Uncharacterized protein n=1 Tax=Sclerotinia sclerotiorum (strain ATCC 18683 / 1980 / Ss-1) TaxID=665079 RepID=A7EYA1_SCLS1|nr:predicted protein [Sclerotinia sclerotiorum 1980 UF-70]EDN94443.1 predicted protein [Sclerotinia sclerotiorum 1980 UF-70]